jgi:hypothetical protein
MGTPSAHSTPIALHFTNLDSERLNSPAMACIRSVVKAQVSITTASGVAGQQCNGKIICNAVVEVRHGMSDVSRAPILYA